MADSNAVLELFDDIGVWSQATFAPDSERGPRGPLKHMVKEIEEELLGEGQDPKSIDELADVLILFCDASRRAGGERGAFSDLLDVRAGLEDMARTVKAMLDASSPVIDYNFTELFDSIVTMASLAGHSFPQLVETAKRKMVKNKLRTYPKTTGDEVSEHDRSKD